MDSILAIASGLVFRFFVDVVSSDNVRVAGTLIGLWEGLVVHHFLSRMPRSPDPYLAFGVRIFIDFLITESLSRMVMVVVWAGIGALLADIGPGIYRDSGFRYLFRSIRRDVRSVQRSVTLPSIPEIRIKNDLPRLFSPSASHARVNSTVTSPRSARIPPPAPAPVQGPPRRQGRSPPGTFPGASGWSETDVDISRGVTTPSIIPSHVDQELEYLGDQIHIRTPQAHHPILPIPPMDRGPNLFTPMTAAAVGLGATMLAESTVHTVIPNTDHQRTPTHGTSSLYPVAASLIDADERNPDQATPRIETLPSIPDGFLFDSQFKQPHQVPLPETRAGSVVGSVFETRSVFDSKEVWKRSMLMRTDTAGEQSEQQDTKTAVMDEIGGRSNSEDASKAQGATNDKAQEAAAEKTEAKEEPASSSQSLPAQSGDGFATMSMPEPEIPHFAPAEPIDQPDAGPSRINEDYPDPDNRTPPPAFTDIYGDNEQNENGTSDPEKLADKPNENYISESELEDDQREAMVKRREFLKRHIEIQTKKRDELDKMHYSLVKAKKGGEQAKGQLDEVQKKLNDLEAKADKKVYLVAAPLSEGPIVVSVAGKKPDEAQIVVSDAIINLLLQRVDANPIVFHFSITNNAKHAKKPAILSLKTAVMAELRINFAPVDDTKSGVNVTVIV